MDKLFGILIFSFIVTFISAVPFINLLYKLKFQRQKETKASMTGETNTIVNRLHSWKVGTPNAGGVLVLLVTGLLAAFFYKFTKYQLNFTTLIIYVTLLGFGLIGFIDDVHKFFGWNKQSFSSRESKVYSWGIKVRYKLLLQIVFALLIGTLLYYNMGMSSVYIPFVGMIDLGFWYVYWAAFVIVATANAVNITDGLDGLSSGLTIIALAALWYLTAQTQMNDISLFIAVMIGSILAFLYFNIYPARVWVGDTGSMAFGSMLAIIALLVNASFILPFIGAVFVIETLSSLIQIFSKAVFKKKVFLAAPIHHHFEAKGWDETKVTMRFWLAGVISAFVGLFIATYGGYF